MRSSLLAAVFLIALGACASGSKEAEAVEEAVKQALKDPGSAEFQGVARCTADETVWSGSVNGKNGFGAYTGFKPFFYTNGISSFPGDAQFSGLLARCYGPTEGAATTGANLETVASEAPPSPTIRVRQEGEIDAEHPNLIDAEPEVAQADECWADYCPCDTSDPDYGYIDVPLCRKLKQGMSVTDEEFNIGASSRDARKSLREFREQNGGDY